MMTDEELTTCHNLLDMLQDCNGEVADYWGRMLEHIDGQASQIATLKAALVQERANKLSCDGKTFHDYTIDAAAQLAKEYPEINWEE